MAEKKTPAKKGTATNPHVPGEYAELTDLEPGVSQVFVIREKTDAGWEDIPSAVETTEKKAKTAARRFLKQFLDNLRGRLEDAFYRANPQNQTRQPVQFTVTKKTTDAEIEKHMNELRAHRKRLSDGEATEKFTFNPDPKQIPEFKVQRMTITVKYTDVETVKYEPPKKKTPAKKSASKKPAKKGAKK